MKAIISFLALGILYHSAVHCQSEPFYSPPDLFGESTSAHYGYIWNHGQLLNSDSVSASEVKFYAEGSAPAAYVMSDKLSLVYYNTTDSVDTNYRLDMKWVGPNVAQSNWFCESRDRSDYVTYHLPHVQPHQSKVLVSDRLVYRDIYPDIDFHVFSNRNGFKACYVIHPGGTPDDIMMEFDGQDSISAYVEEVNMWLDEERISMPQLVAYEVDQEDKIVPLEWLPEYQKFNDSTVTVATGQYNSSNYLVLLLCNPENADRGARGGGNYENIDWSTYIKGDKTNTSYQVITDDSGSVYIAGKAKANQFPISAGVNVVQTLAEGGFDATLIKFDSNGVRQWATYYGGPKEEDEINLLVGPDKQLFLVGTTRHLTTTASITQPFQQPSGAYLDWSVKSSTGGLRKDLFIAELSTDADSVKWATYFGGTGDERHPVVDIDESGNIFIASVGTPNSPFKLKTGAYNDTLSDGALVMRFNADRSLEWCTHFELNQDGEIYAIDVDEQGYIYIAGDAGMNLPIANPGGLAYMDSSFVNDSSSTTRGFFARFHESDYSLNWSTYFSGQSTSRMYDIIGRRHGETPTTSIYLFGYTSSSGLPYKNPGNNAHFDTLITGSISQSDNYIARISGVDTVEWCTLLGGDGSESSGSITLAPSEDIFGAGNLIVSGSTGGQLIPESFDCVQHSNWYYDCNDIVLSDNYLAIFNENHEYIYGTQIGGSEPEDHPYAAVFGDYLYFSATTRTPTIITPDPYPLVDLGGTSWFDSLKVNTQKAGIITRFNLNYVEDTLTSVIKHQKTENIIRIYPNPTNDMLTIVTNGTYPLEMKIFNIQGQLLKSGIVNDGDMISLASFPSGVYVIRAGRQSELLIKH